MDHELDLKRAVAVFVKDLQDKLDLVNKDLPENMTALKLISELKPASWIWNSNEARNGELDFGFIAQDIVELQKKYGVDFNLVRQNGEYLWLYPENFIYILLLAVQEIIGDNDVR